MPIGEFLLAKQLGQERRDINKQSRQAGRALEKRSRWGGIGRMIGQIGAPMLAAAAFGGPIGWAGAALATGVGSYLGGKWGREGAANLAAQGAPGSRQMLERLNSASLVLKK